MGNVDWVVWTICRWESGEWREDGCKVEEERLYSMKTSRTAVSIRSVPKSRRVWQRPICVYNAVDIFSASRVMVEEVEKEGSSIMMSKHKARDEERDKKS
jgi:hypothetical protein